MRSVSLRRTTPAVLALVSLAVVGLAQPAAAAPPNYRADAHASAAVVDTVVTAPVTFGRADVNFTTSLPANDAATLPGGISAPVLGTTGAVATTAAAQDIGNTRIATATAGVSGVSLLAGQISADYIGSAAGASITLGAPVVVTGGTTTVQNLKIGSQTFNGALPPNTSVSIAGVAVVHLNEQVPVAGGDGIRVTPVRIEVLGILGAPVAEVGIATSQATVTP
ncbi:choice-of-anchor P family protein [Actinokineospora diospyrosa]|uniref:Sortase n=1 Tax=Actinokineospora diospyrosa TaxID=103728 RepID=A0ABT1INI5_9PSEU|nr:choice-of-anchor P family protein [Actinokineospora diospyrosa]MCP2274230.1 hypothetical protein [Actinokineospora diospyrosa]